VMLKGLLKLCGKGAQDVLDAATTAKSIAQAAEAKDLRHRRGCVN
jgi:hypothetical protein